MALSAGSVEAILRGRFDPAGFVRFDAAMKASHSRANSFEKGYAASQSRVSAATAAMGAVAKKAAVGGVAALGYGMVKSVGLAASFEQQLSALGSVSGATGKQMASLKKQAMDAGAATKYSALDAAQAQTELAKGGLSVANIMGGGLNSALALAAAGDLDLADAAAYTANAMNLFGLKGKDSMKVADGLATAANATTADVSDFGYALEEAGAISKTSGLSFEQTVTWLEALAASGVKGSKGGTAMGSAINQIINATPRATALMEKYNLSFFDSSGKMKDTASIAGMLRKELGGLTGEQRAHILSTIGSSNGLKALTSLYDIGAKGAKRYTDGLTQTGTAAQVAAAKQDNFKGKLENFKGSVETAGITIGEKLLPKLSAAAVAGTDFINNLSKTGQLEHGAEAVANGFEQAARVVIEFAHAAGGLAGMAAAAAGPLISLGKALDLGDASKIAAIVAAIAAFKVARSIIPIVTELGSSIASFGSLAATAFKGGEMKTFGSMMVGALNPVTLAAGGLAVGIGALVMHHQKVAAAAREAAAAEKEFESAITGANSAALELVDAEKGDLVAKQAATKAQATVNRLKREGKTNTKEYKAAVEDLTNKNNQYSKSTQTLIAAQKTYSDQLKQSESSATKHLNKNFETAGISKHARDMYSRGSLDQINARADIAAAGKLTNSPENDKKAAVALRAYTLEMNKAIVTEANLQRTRKGSVQIQATQQTALAKTLNGMKGLSKAQKIKLAVDYGTSLNKLGSIKGKVKELGGMKAVPKLLAADKASPGILNVVKKLDDYGHTKKVAQILAESSSASAKVQALKRELASIPAVKRVQIEVNKLVSSLPKKRAAGRAGTGTENALVGEGGGPEYVIDAKTGQGFKTNGPLPIELGPNDYVVPTEARYAARGRQLLRELQRGLGGRAAGLMAMAAKDLGMETYAKGKKGKKSKNPKGYDKAAAGAMSVDTLTAKRDAIKEDLDKAEERAKNKELSKAKRAAAKRNASTLRKKLADANKLLKAAKNFEAQQQKQGELGDIYSGDADVSAGNEDQAGFDAAKSAEQETITARLEKLNKAVDKLGGVKKAKRSKRGRELLQRINELKQREQALKASKLEVPEDTARADKAAALAADLTTLDTAMTQAGKVLASQAKVASQVITKRKELLAFAKQGGDAGEIADAKQQLVQAEESLKDIRQQQAANKVSRALASAALTQSLTDDLSAVKQQLALKQQLYTVAYATGDDGLIAEAEGELKSAQDAVNQVRQQMLEVTGAKIATAMDEAGKSIDDQIDVAISMLAYQRKYLEFTQEVGTDVEIEQSKQSVLAAKQKLEELQATAASNKVAQVVAAAALTATLIDDIDAAKQKYDLQADLYAAAQATGDAGEIASATDALRSAQDEVTAITQKAALDAMERDKALAALTTTITDDKAAAQAFATYWATQLELAKATGSDELIADVASKLKSAQNEALAASDAIREQVDKYFNLKREVFSQFGQNYIANGSSGSVGAATNSKSITINNTYLKQPEDPHLWSAGVLNQVEALS